MKAAIEEVVERVAKHPFIGKSGWSPDIVYSFAKMVEVAIRSERKHKIDGGYYSNVSVNGHNVRVTKRKQK